ncbi:unnamed protein product [Phytophthora lilii]|uniref:Unnamed protein product n=1 Tax=Phytophthora lilii TaxID=2077276 RepID=A0A9W6WQ64_9STRA|nr:unnamed protein product [Phytophthora lilii]
MVQWSVLLTSFGSSLLAANELVSRTRAIELTAVSVCQDATFQVPISRGVVCSGHGDQPLGVECPRAGDIALDECYPYLDSYNGEKCVAKEDAQCVYLDRRDAWGCTFPSTWCSSYLKVAPEETHAQHSCSWWDFDEDVNSASSSDSFDVGNQADCDQAWFSKTTVTTLYYCNGDLAISAPTQEQATAIPLTESDIPVYISASDPTQSTTSPTEMPTTAPVVGEENLTQSPETVIGSPAPSETPSQTEQTTRIPAFEETTEATITLPAEELTAPTITPQTPTYTESGSQSTLPVTQFPSEEPIITSTNEVSSASPNSTISSYTNVEAETPIYAPNETIPSSPIPASTIAITTAPETSNQTSITENFSWYSAPTPTAEVTISPAIIEPATPTPTPTVTDDSLSTEGTTSAPSQEWNVIPSATETLVPTSTEPLTTEELYVLKANTPRPKMRPSQSNYEPPTATDTQTPVPARTPTTAPSPYATAAPSPSSTEFVPPYDESASLDFDDVGTESKPTATPCTDSSANTTEAPMPTPTAALSLPSTKFVAPHDNSASLDSEDVGTESTPTATPCTSSPADTTEAPMPTPTAALSLPSTKFVPPYDASASLDFEDVGTESTPTATPCTSSQADTTEKEAPTSTPTSAQTATPTEENVYIEQTPTQSTMTDTTSSEMPSTEDPSTTEAPTTDKPATEVPTTTPQATERPTTEAPVATVATAQKDVMQDVQQEDEQQSYKQTSTTILPSATAAPTTRPPTKAPVMVPVSTTSTVQPAVTPCATSKTLSNKHLTLQASTQADLTTSITTVTISAAAVVAIIIAVGSIVVVSIAVIRVRGRYNMPPFTNTEERQFDHSIVVTPSDF